MCHQFSRLLHRYFHGFLALKPTCNGPPSPTTDITLPPRSSNGIAVRILSMLTFWAFRCCQANSCSSTDGWLNPRLCFFLPRAMLASLTCLPWKPGRSATRGRSSASSAGVRTGCRTRCFVAVEAYPRRRLRLGFLLLVMWLALLRFGRKRDDQRDNATSCRHAFHAVLFALFTVPISCSRLQDFVSTRFSCLPGQNNPTEADLQQLRCIIVGGCLKQIAT